MVLNFAITETIAVLRIWVRGPPAAEHGAKLNVGWLADGEHLARHTSNLPDITSDICIYIHYIMLVHTCSGPPSLAAPPGP